MAVNLCADSIADFAGAAKKFIGLDRRRMIADRDDISSPGYAAQVGASVVLDQVDRVMQSMWTGPILQDTATRFGTYPFSDVFIGLECPNLLPDIGIYESLRELPGCPGPTAYTEIGVLIIGELPTATIMVVRIHRELKTILEIFIPFDTRNGIGRFRRSDFIGGIDSTDDKMNTALFIGDFILTLYFDDDQLRFVKISNSAIPDIEKISEICSGQFPLVIGAKTTLSSGVTVVNGLAIGVEVADGVITSIYNSRLINPATMMITPKQFAAGGESSEWKMYGKLIMFEWSMHGVTQVMKKFTITSLLSNEIVTRGSQALIVAPRIEFAKLSPFAWMYRPMQSAVLCNVADADSDSDFD